MLTNRERAEGFGVGELVRATANIQGLVLGRLYRIAGKKPGPHGVLEYEVRGVCALLIRNLPLFAERVPEKDSEA